MKNIVVFDCLLNF